MDVLLRTLVLKAFPHCLVSGHHHGFMFKGTSLCIGNKIEIFFWIVAFCSAILGALSEEVSPFQSRLQISSLPAAIWAWNFASFFWYLTVFLVFYISWYGIWSFSFLTIFTNPHKIPGAMGIGETVMVKNWPWGSRDFGAVYIPGDFLRICKFRR